MTLSSTSEELATRLSSGDVSALARALTLVENRAAAGREVVQRLYARTGNAHVVGITGAPGAGKSTLVDQLICLLRRRGQRVAVLAVDPSSAFTRGAILGDRIRMLRHHADPDVFIRSMSSRGQLGGIAAATWEAALVLDAAGWNTVLIETVGVGQDEVAIAQIARTTVLVLTPQMGDDVQAIKAGIMEIADVFAVNKADLGGAERLMEHIRAAQSLALQSSGSDTAPVCRISAASGEGVEALWGEIEKTLQRPPREAGEWERWGLRLRELLHSDLLSAIPEDLVLYHAKQVAERREDPYAAVGELKRGVGLG